jgi:hypothetical protein
MYKIITAIPENTQNDYRPSSDVWAPKKKAKASVSEVMVIEGPAVAIASFIRVFTGLFMSV